MTDERSEHTASTPEDLSSVEIIDDLRAEVERLKVELAFERELNVRMPIKRVEQTTPRNCGQACLAMVFGLSIDDVPKEASAEFWDEQVVQNWLSQRGLQQIRVRCFDQSIYSAYNVRCIVDGKSPRGEKLHAVVATMQGPQGWVLDADPHPDNNGIADEPFSASFFALKNPAEYIAKDATIAAQAAEIELLKAEATWVRRKLKLPEDATSSKLYGEMHVFEAHAHGYTAFIAAYKCDDKEGEIARLAHEVFTKDAELAALRSQLEEQRAKTIDVLEEADDYVSCTPYNERPEESNQRNGFLKVLRDHVASLKST